MQQVDLKEWVLFSEPDGFIGLVEDLEDRGPSAERFRATTGDGKISFFPTAAEALEYLMSASP